MVVRRSVSRATQLGQLSRLSVLLAAVIAATDCLERCCVVVLAVAENALLDLSIGIEVGGRQLLAGSIL